MTRRIIIPREEIKRSFSPEGSTKRVHTIEEYVPNKPSLPPPDPDSIPLELMPTLRTIKGYGRRMNAIGALRVAWTLDKVINGIMPHISKYPELVDIILDAKNNADLIRAEASSGASFEQDDGDTPDDT